MSTKYQGGRITHLTLPSQDTAAIRTRGELQERRRNDSGFDTLWGGTGQRRPSTDGVYDQRRLEGIVRNNADS
jgi:hypothetical protein